MPAAQDHQDAGHFPSDDAATKLIWLALRNITADWGRAAKDWKEAMNQFARASVRLYILALSCALSLPDWATYTSASEYPKTSTKSARAGDCRRQQHEADCILQVRPPPGTLQPLPSVDFVSATRQRCHHWNFAASFAFQSGSC
jgi:hypothetical protein